MIYIYDIFAIYPLNSGGNMIKKEEAGAKASDWRGGGIGVARIFTVGALGALGFCRGALKL